MPKRRAVPGRRRDVDDASHVADALAAEEGHRALGRSGEHRQHEDHPNPGHDVVFDLSARKLMVKVFISRMGTTVLE